MPHTKANPAAKKADRKPQSGSKPTVTQQVRAEHQERLRAYIERFVNEAWTEEIHFLSDVLMDWESNRTGGSRHPEDFEVPIYTAFQLNINDKALIEVPFSKKGQVNEFVAGLAVDNCIQGLEEQA
jgi:hypothetical protein